MVSTLVIASLSTLYADHPFILIDMHSVEPIYFCGLSKWNVCEMEACSEQYFINTAELNTEHG